MFSGKKNEGGMLPDLPPLKTPFDSDPDLEDGDYEDTEPQALPAFPDSPSHNNFSQAAIKDAVADKNSHVVEMEEWAPSEDDDYPDEDESLPMVKEDSDDEEERFLPPPPREPPQRQVEEIEPPRKDFGSTMKDVFVKIDKFHSARKAINDVRSKLDDIDSLIKKIRETKLREEQEISNWEKDLAYAKSRVDEVTQNIFEKVA